MAETWPLRNLLRRQGICRSLVPLYPDVSWTTAAAASGQAVVQCDTTLRRLFAGARIVIAVPPLQGTVHATFETGVISSLSSTAITLTANLANSYPKNSRVLPLLECDVVAETSPKRLPGGKLQMASLAREVPGVSALPALAAPGSSSVFSSYSGYPVFDPGFNKGVEWLAAADGWKRTSKSASLGQGTVWTMLGPRPRASAGRAIRIDDRQDAWNFLTFFDICQGPTTPFFAPSPLPFFLPTAMTTTTITVPAEGQLEDWNDYPYIAAVKRAAGPTAARVRPIASVARASGFDTIMVSDPFDFSDFTQVWYVTAANLMRFAAGGLTEKWTTSRFLGLDFNLIEVVNEKTVAWLTSGGLCPGGGASGEGSVPCNAAACSRSYALAMTSLSDSGAPGRGLDATISDPFSVGQWSGGGPTTPDVGNYSVSVDCQPGGFYTITLEDDGGDVLATMNTPVQECPTGTFTVTSGAYTFTFVIT
jgi:hypothetical protein